MGAEPIIPYDGMYQSKDGTTVYELRYSRSGSWYVLQTHPTEVFLDRSVDLGSLVYLGRIKNPCKRCDRFAIFNSGLCAVHERERCAATWAKTNQF